MRKKFSLFLVALAILGWSVPASAYSLNITDRECYAYT
jgi:hypothetical protein